MTPSVRPDNVSSASKGINWMEDVCRILKIPIVCSTGWAMDVSNVL